MGTIVAEHRDRLASSGSEHPEAALAAQGRRTIVVDGDELADDLVLDMTKVLTSMCARLHERHNTARRAQASVAAPGAWVTGGEGADAGTPGLPVRARPHRLRS